MKLRFKEVLVPVESYTNSTGAMCRTDTKLQYYVPSNLNYRGSNLPVPGKWVDVETVSCNTPDEE